MRRIVYILISCCILFVSCKNFLDVTPTGMVVPETVTHYDQMLNNIWEGCLNEAIYMDPDIYTLQPKLSYMWPDKTIEGEEDDAVYSASYANIYVANTILDNIDKANIENNPEQLRTRVKRDALAERAVNYFILVNTYAPAYNGKTSVTDLTIPIKQNTDLHELPSNATVKQVYDYLLKDLLQAY